MHENKCFLELAEECGGSRLVDTHHDGYPCHKTRIIQAAASVRL
jgi:hypothetical protein